MCEITYIQSTKCIKNAINYIITISISTLKQLEKLQERYEAGETISNHHKLNKIQVAALEYRGFDVPERKRTLSIPHYRN